MELQKTTLSLAVSASAAALSCEISNDRAGALKYWGWVFGEALL